VGFLLVLIELFF